MSQPLTSAELAQQIVALQFALDDEPDALEGIYNEQMALVAENPRAALDLILHLSIRLPGSLEPFKATVS
jgi:hypothetical protein